MSNNPTPAQADPNNPAVQGGALGGAVGTSSPGSTYPVVPDQGNDQAQYDALQKQIDAIDNNLGALDQDYDNALIEFDNAQTAVTNAQQAADPQGVKDANTAVANARSKAQLAQRRAEQARVAQNRYLTQQNRVADRIAKTQAQNDPQAQAEHEQRMAAAQAQIDANKATTDLANARLNKEFDPKSVDADNALKTAQTTAQTANAAYDQARAAAYPAESAASVGASNASAAANNAQAAQIQALIAAGMPAAQAAAEVAQGEASRAATAVSAEDLHQKQIGELGTLREQLDKGVQAWTQSKGATGTSPDDARRIYQTAVDKAATGATPYDRQNQTAANRLAFARDAMQNGGLVNTNQTTAVGGEPGGVYQQLDAAMGQPIGNYSLQGTMPIPAAIGSLGADVSQPYTAQQLGMPTSADAFSMDPSVSAGAAPTANTGGVPPAVSSLGTRAPNDWRGLDGKQLELARRAMVSNPANAVTVAGG